MNDIKWLEPWLKIEVERQNHFEVELKREVKSGHPLYQVEVKAMAQRVDCDAVLFSLSNHASALAVVHLTYAASEVSPEWPHTQFFVNLEAWLEDCMRDDDQDAKL